MFADSGTLIESGPLLEPRVQQVYRMNYSICHVHLQATGFVHLLWPYQMKFCSRSKCHALVLIVNLRITCNTCAASIILQHQLMLILPFSYTVISCHSLWTHTYSLTSKEGRNIVANYYLLFANGCHTDSNIYLWLKQQRHIHDKT